MSRNENFILSIVYLLEFICQVRESLGNTFSFKDMLQLFLKALLFAALLFPSLKNIGRSGYPTFNAVLFAVDILAMTLMKMNSF